MTELSDPTVGPVEFEVKLASGREWHSEPIPLQKGDQVRITALGNDRFYAGLFRRDNYVTLRAAASGAFAFEFGTDVRSWTVDAEASRSDDYYLVFRVGVFTSGTTTIQVRWVLARPR